jgi:hypothetical protein
VALGREVVAAWSRDGHTLEPPRSDLVAGASPIYLELG